MSCLSCLVVVILFMRNSTKASMNQLEIIRQSSCSRHAVSMQSSCGPYAVIRQLSGSCQAVVRQSSGSRLNFLLIELFQSFFLSFLTYKQVLKYVLNQSHPLKKNKQTCFFFCSTNGNEHSHYGHTGPDDKKSLIFCYYFFAVVYLHFFIIK